MAKSWRDKGASPWHAVLWRDGPPVPGPAAPVASRADGSWSVKGLMPGAHWVEPGRIPHIDLHPELVGALGREVHAPAERVFIEIEGADLRVLAQSEGQPIEDAWIEVDAGGNSTGSRTRKDGALETVLAWDVEYEIRVSATAHEPATVKIRPRASSWEPEHVIELVRRAARPTLLVMIATPGGSPIRDVGFGLYREGRDQREPWRIQDFEGGKGAFRIGELAGGRYRLVIRPGGQWHFGRSTYQETEHQVEIPAEGETRLEVTARPGGSL